MYITSISRTNLLCDITSISRTNLLCEIETEEMTLTIVLQQHKLLLYSVSILIQFTSNALSITRSVVVFTVGRTNLLCEIETEEMTLTIVLQQHKLLLYSVSILIPFTSNALSITRSVVVFTVAVSHAILHGTDFFVTT